MSRAAYSPALPRATGRATLLLALALAFAAGCAAPDGAPRATIVNGSAVELRDVTFLSSKGGAFPAADVLAPGESASARLEIEGEDAVSVSLVADGRLVVSRDSVYAEGAGGYRARFVVDSTLDVVAAPTRIGVYDAGR